MSKQGLHGILLESGTDELEVLVFLVRGQRDGVNVAKTREVTDPVPCTCLPQSHPAVTVIPVIDLPFCFGHKDAKAECDGKVIVMEFNDLRVGLRVDEVHYIHRANVKDVETTPDIEGMREAPVTFVIQIEDDLILMVDFERIMFDIAGVDLFGIGPVGAGVTVDRGARRILHAEDSHTMRTVIHSNLRRAAYTNIVSCVDGQDAIDTLERDVEENSELTIDRVITDIEMPKIDGLRLTRLIKEHPRLKDVPVITFSSLVSQDNEKKCEAVGANAQITKPRLGLLVDPIDGLVVNANSAVLA